MGNNKNILSFHETEKAFVIFEEGSGLYKKNLGN